MSQQTLTHPSEISFRYLNCAVYQVQIARRRDAVPPVREPMVETERALAFADGITPSLEAARQWQRRCGGGR
jgi:hypothetical protein